jgi:hypothetical protein
MVGVVAFSLVATLVANADTIAPVSSSSGFSSFDIANWQQTHLGYYQPGTPPAVNGYFVEPSGDHAPAASNTLTLTFGNGTTTPGQVLQEGVINGWAGGSGIFDPLEFLVSTNNTNYDNTDSLKISFNSKIQGFGVEMQDQNLSKQFTATMTAYDQGGNVLGATTLQSDSTGDPIYLGLLDSTSANIKSIVISDTSTPSSNANFFLIGSGDVMESGSGVTGSTGSSTATGSTGSSGPPINTGNVPEPGSVLLLAGGLGALVWKFRKSSKA